MSILQGVFISYKYYLEQMSQYLPRKLYGNTKDFVRIWFKQKKGGWIVKQS